MLCKLSCYLSRANDYCFCCVQVPVVRPQLHECPVRHHGSVRVRPSRGRLHPAGRLQVNGICARISRARLWTPHFSRQPSHLGKSSPPLSQRSDRQPDRQRDRQPDRQTALRFATCFADLPRTQANIQAFILLKDMCCFGCLLPS